MNQTEKKGEEKGIKIKRLAGGGGGGVNESKVQDLINVHANRVDNPHSVTHSQLPDKGIQTHSQIDTHIGDSTIHYAEGTIDHTHILNIGSNSHNQIDNHIASTSNPHSVTLSQVGGTTDHTALSNIGTNTHVQIDSHIANTSNPHSVTKTQIGIEDGTVAGQVLFWDGSQWVHTEVTELFWDDIDKELGIGTATPDEPLTVRCDFDGNKAIRMTNESSGTSAVARIIVDNNGGSSYFTGYGSNFIQNGARIPNSSALIASNNRTGGMSIVARNANAPVRIYAGGIADANLRLMVNNYGNIGINTPDQFGSGQKVMGIANASVIPSTNPVGGGILYASGGLLYFRDSSGNVYLLSHDLTELKWEDLRVPLTSTKLGGVQDPDFTVYKTDGAGSQGVFLYWFDKNLEEEIYFMAQIPHSYSEETDIIPHVHWVPKVNGGANEFVKWGLEYIWQNLDDVYGNTTIIYSDASGASTATTSGDSSMVADKHYITEIGTITGTGKEISSMLACRLFRDATDGDDDYDNDAGLLEIDFHFQNDGRGSDTEYIK